MKRDARSERGRGGRLVEAIDIATMEDKMLMEEVLSNTTVRAPSYKLSPSFIL